MAPEGSEQARTGGTPGETTGAATAVGDAPAVGAAPGEPPGVPEPQDWRYPRPGWFRALRWILRLWWLAFALYAGNALFNLVTVAAQQGVPALESGATVAQALLLTQLLRLWSSRPPAVVAGALLVAALVLAGRWAHRDRARERDALARRAEAARQRALVDERLPVALAQLGVVAAAAEPIPAPQPQGPPFDEDLLPIPDHFVGREADLAWVLGRLRTGGATAITALGGMGGIGKTTLAAAAIRRLRAEGRFPDGVAVVLCQDLTDPTKVLRRVLTRFDAYRKAPEEMALADLARKASFALKGKDALLVLDNVEPGLAVAEVVVPLRSAGVTMLLTARQALPPAAIPADGSRQLDLLAAGEALRVFADALGRGSADALSPAEHAAAERIVAALDRHTLAVKLAGAYAAQARRDLGALARELEDPEHGLDLPEGEAPRAVARVFAQSTAALPEDARHLFAALATFATPEFGRRAVLALAEGLGQIDPRASVDLLVLRALVEASVDEALPEDADRERLRLHPLLHAFARGLFARGLEVEREAMSLAAARHYAAYAEANQVRAPTLAADESNLTGALAWAVDRRVDEVIARVCFGLLEFWHSRWRLRTSAEYLPAGHRAANALLARDESPEAWRRACWITFAYGRVLHYEGRNEEAERVLREAIAGAVRAGERGVEARARCLLGQIALYGGLLDEAERAFQESQAAAAAANDLGTQGANLVMLGRVAQLRGRFADAARAYEEALAIFQATGERQAEASALSALAGVAYNRGEFDAAERYARQSLPAFREEGDTQGEAMVLHTLGIVAERRGALGEAEADVLRSLDLLRAIQDEWDVAIMRWTLGRIQLKQGQLDEAREHVLAGLATLREVRDRRNVAKALCVLADIAVAQNDLPAARTAYEESLELAQATDSRPEIAEAEMKLGRLLAERLGLPEEGRPLIVEAVRRYAEMGLPEEREAREVAWRLGGDV